ncbi:hypothetical protein TrVE_jg7607 [Triparma verrucosa]|uniref:Uncharacterized protein n=2 Tax=Triparma TaxID=722752 RepID=A0A9W7C2Z1_9STRA|nr:hypothetical protein TrVE_jg7607 [Triparma verrucosa]GMI01002.1 hypothetical protein TrST_g5458 [Triparma strigata]
MGNCNAKESVGNSPPEQHSAATFSGPGSGPSNKGPSFRSNHIMSKSSVLPEQDANSAKWKDVEDIHKLEDKFHADGSLAADDFDKGHIELRALLDEPMAQAALGEYAKSKYTQESFFAWTEIQEYRHIPTADYRRCNAMHIYEKYIKKDAVCEVGSISEEIRLEWDEKIKEFRKNKHMATEDVLDGIQHTCFTEMYLNTYMPFKRTDEYKQLNHTLKSTYNKVGLEDFDYIAKLGVGGFGRVVHVKKKSTGKHYAMKTQLKTALVETYADNPSRLDSEKTVFAVCHHPFIIDMDYAFQTEGHAILVLGLATAGDLQEAIDNAPDNRLEEQRVVFYAAEIALALAHLHDLHLMYRDLKPCNVLLNEDGNIKLADMGGVADFGGDILYTEEEKVNAPKEDFRRKSIMGTHGYMAPEMVKMLGQSRSQRSGYTAAVDYWSLGVTVYKLLTGYRPFDSMYGEEESTNAQQQLKGVQGNSEFRALHRAVDYPSYISDTARSFIQGLLDTNEKTRIGCDENGIDGLKMHMFFNGLDWITMQQCHLEAPYIPDVPPPKDKPAYKSYEEMMKQIDKDELEELGVEEIDWSQIPTAEEQKFFESWDFVSPHTLKVEMGIANAIAGYNENFKVRQMLGDNMSGAMIKEGMHMDDNRSGRSKKGSTFKMSLGFGIKEE